MLHSNPNILKENNQPQNIRTDKRSFLIQENDVPLPPQQFENFKMPSLLQKNSRRILFKELIRFLIYAFFFVLILSAIGKNSSSPIYSFISKDSHTEKLSLKKQIPGLFPALSKNWEQLLTKWDITLLNGKNGAKSLKSDHYQLQFKHFDKRQDVVYITRGTCQGHLVMNWEVHGNNIYLTDFIPPKDSMTILNQPEDELCIKQNSEFYNLLKFSTVWTIEEQDEKTALFLLVEDTISQNQKGNYVLVGQSYQNL